MKELSGEQKAAILVVLLGEETSSKMLEHLSKRDVARIAREIADLGRSNRIYLAPSWKNITSVR